MSEPVIQAVDLAKTFRPSVIALSGLDLAVPRGAVYGLIGRNGAGKSTCLRLLMGLLRPDRGRAQVFGQDLKNAPRELRQRVAYVSQEQQLPWWMTARELTHYYAQLYDGWDQTHADRLLGTFDLAADRPLAGLSGGDQRRVAVVLALAARPEVVILDEPAAGLDPLSRRQLIEAMIDFLGEGGERTVLFSTHILADLERVADHIGFMDRGRMMMSGPLEQLQSGLRRVQLIFPGDRVPDGFELAGQMRREVSGPVLTAVVRLTDPGQIDRLRAMEGVRVSEQTLGLEDLFLELMDRGAGGPASETQPDAWWRQGV